MGDQTDPRPLTAEEIEQMRPGIEHDAPIGSSWFGRLLASYDLVVAERDAARAEPRAEGLRDRDFVAAKLMESAWGTRANLDMPEARIVANYLASFGIAATTP